MKLTIETTWRRWHTLTIKWTGIDLASISFSNDSTTITINNFDCQELHWTKEKDRNILQKYIIQEIRKDKRLYNKYKML